MFIKGHKYKYIGPDNLYINHFVVGDVLTYTGKHGGSYSKNTVYRFHKDDDTEDQWLVPEQLEPTIVVGKRSVIA